MSLLGQTLRSQTAFAPIFVRYASRSDQTIAAQRNDATCQSRHFASQQNRGDSI